MKSEKSTFKKFLRKVFILVFLMGIIGLANAQKITIKGTEFLVGSDRIWLNGVNTP